MNFAIVKPHSSSAFSPKRKNKLWHCFFWRTGLSVFSQYKCFSQIRSNFFLVIGAYYYFIVYFSITIYPPYNFFHLYPPPFLLNLVKSKISTNKVFISTCYYERGKIIISMFNIKSQIWYNESEYNFTHRKNYLKF